MNLRDAYIALNMMEGIGPVGVRSLISALGSPAAIFEAGESDLMRADGIGPEMAASILRQRGDIDPGKEQEEAARAGARILTPLDEEYPKALAAIYDPPLALYVIGTLELKDQHALAVVGTRHPTHYGTAIADRISWQLAQAGFSVVSGLARGIDTAGHNGALRGKGRTLAVLGSAIDRLYPPENSELARRIAESGAVLSEFALGTEPGRTTFPIRNRIVSGLSKGVLVVEAGLKSGAMITARVAAEQGRTVFAVPGRVDSPASKGTHQLLKAGARLVEDVDDILDELQFLFPKPASGARALGAPRPVLSGDEARVVELLGARREMDADELTRTLGLRAADASATLLALEMKRLVRMMPGRVVQIVE